MRQLITLIIGLVLLAGSGCKKKSNAVASPFNIPTSFTPNSNAVNDTWVIQVSSNVTLYTYHLEVFGTDKSIIFSTDDIDKAWDGRYKGNILPDDNYFYRITYDIGNGKQKAEGYVTILR